MSVLQDRWQQKQLLSAHNIPSARYLQVHSHISWEYLLHTFPQGMVLKKKRHGYDGYGTHIVRSKKHYKSGKHFISINKNNLIAEEFIPFKRELAVILVRNRQNQIIELPLVETHQKNSCCVWVRGPCTHPKKSSLIRRLKTMLSKINYEGVIAFELFETQKGELLINELAPRVHNSGHYSLNALSEDQFSLHIKAVLNLSLTPPSLHTKGFAMLNLLGDKQTKQDLVKITKTPAFKKGLDLHTVLGRGAISPKSIKRALPGPVYLHWYGKTLSRPGRKMGHLNSLASTPRKALNQLLHFQKKYL